MNFCPAPLWRLPLLAGTLLALAFSAGAQQGGEPIIFSSPEGGEVSSNLTRLAKPLDVPDAFQAATPDFGADLPSGGAPPLAIPPAASISQGQQLQSLLNPKKDWTLMTPGEIMGVISPDKTFQAPERDAMGLRKNPSALENFLGRQSGSQSSATNNFFPADSSSSSRFSRNSDFQPGADRPNSASDNPGGTPTFLSRLFNNTPQRNDNFSSPNAGAGSWNQFGNSYSQPTSDSGQSTEMNQFKQLLGASPSASAAPATPSYNSSSSAFFTSQPSANNGFSQPVINPIGTSYTPLNSGIGTPTGLAPLPTVTGQSSLQSVTTPAWTSQAPPWTLQGPQPFVIPQRKF